MHWHGYLYAGRHGKMPRFDAYNRDPDGAGFSISHFPPNFLAHWLRKPPSFIQGTWEDPSKAMNWAMGLFQSAYSSPERMTRSTGVSIGDHTAHGLEQLRMGNDVLLATNGEQGPDYREIYVISCPNAGGTAECPIGRRDQRPEGSTIMTGIP